MEVHTLIAYGPYEQPERAWLPFGLVLVGESLAYLAAAGQMAFRLPIHFHSDLYDVIFGAVEVMLSISPACSTPAP